jgi:hypothetical protein
LLQHQQQLGDKSALEAATKAEKHQLGKQTVDSQES